MQKYSETRRKINEYCANSGKYPPDAYEFVTESVILQVKSLPAPRHLTALELLQGMSRQLEEEFGILAPEVLKNWQIKTASDIGEIVFDLIELKILSASAEDNREDFDINYSFPHAPSTGKKHRNREIPKIDC